MKVISTTKRNSPEIYTQHRLEDAPHSLSTVTVHGFLQIPVATPFTSSAPTSLLQPALPARREVRRVSLRPRGRLIIVVSQQRRVDSDAEAPLLPGLGLSA